MNPQIRRLYLVVFVLFSMLALAATYIQVIAAPSLNADSRNARTIYQDLEFDRGPIIVAGDAIARSTLIEGTRRYQREYPGGALYAPITGWFSSALSSKTGLEESMNDALRGESVSLFQQRIQDLFTGKEPRGGAVALTVKPAVQQAAADLFASRRGGAVALDPTTGAILALYSSPSFDPTGLASSDTSAATKLSDTLEHDPNRPLINRAIAGDRYPPGSAFKIVTAAAMLESGQVTPDSTVDGPASIPLPGTDISLPNITGLPCGSGKPTLTEAFARSCNTPFGSGALSVGGATLAAKARDFGFGESLDIPLAVTPSVAEAPPDQAKLAMTGIGQSDVQVTPLQMAMVGAAVANGGKIMKPYLVESILNADLETMSTTTPELLTTALTPEVANQLRTMMEAVVTQPYGTGTELASASVPVAAKTGTAETGRDRTIAWTIAFAPVDQPRVVVAVALEGDDDTPYVYGGSDAAPIARAMIDAAVGGS